MTHCDEQMAHVRLALTEIREIIINEKNKLRGITLNKCVIINDILYYKDRL